MNKLIEQIDKTIIYSKEHHNDLLSLCFKTYLLQYKVKNGFANLSSYTKQELTLYYSNSYGEDEMITPEFLFLFSIETLTKSALNDSIYYETICAICDNVLEKNNFPVFSKYGYYLLANLDKDFGHTKTKNVLTNAYDSHYPFSKVFLAEFYLISEYKDLDKTISILQEALKQKKDAEAYALLGMVYLDKEFNNEKLDEAYSNLNEAYKLKDQALNLETHFYRTITNLIDCIGRQYETYINTIKVDELQKSMNLALEYTKLHHELEYAAFNDIFNNKLSLLENYYTKLLDIKIGASVIEQPFYTAIQHFLVQNDEEYHAKNEEEIKILS